MFWIESPMNPSMTILDIKAIADVVHAKSKAFFVVDNTFLAPYFQCPLKHDTDIVSYSISKFIGGHSDIITGSIATNDWKFFEKLKSYHITPFDVYLISL